LLKKEFQASFDSLHEILTLVAVQARECGFQDSHLSRLELAVEEAIVNIIHYANLPKTATIKVSIGSTAQKQSLKVIIEDSGLPFNPIIHGKIFNPSEEVNPDELGGYGIYFILVIMDCVEYKRENGFNIMTLTKHVKESPPLL